MKQIYFNVFLFISIASYSQQLFQIELVDANIGYVDFEGLPSNVSNDDGLNQIFVSHNVSYYQNAEAYQIPEMIGKIQLVRCNSCDPNLFLQDLNAYSSVIRVANYDLGNGTLYNGLSLKLVDDAIGIPSGILNGIITTNDSSLNQIFTDFAVRLYENTLVGTSYEHYEIVCDCDAELLKQDLDNYSSLILSTAHVFFGVTLSLKDETLENTKVYPNPFDNSLKIETNIQLKEILLFDILGKLVYKSNSKADFENFSSLINSGVYILKLTDKKGGSITKKIVKN